MKLVATQNDRDLAAMLRGLLAARGAGAWDALATAGIFGLGIPEEYGGSGGTLSELGIFAREAGRALCPFPIHSTLFAAHAVYMLGGEESRHRWLPDLSAGR
ncbi:MAG TPA: acyl-CoA dehydrogenase family protein, partial [Mycobacterium sp.]|nr:acyl-CoA dehydrogenase family protein [Mycobacterium sp.]